MLLNCCLFSKLFSFLNLKNKWYLPSLASTACILSYCAIHLKEILIIVKFWQPKCIDWPLLMLVRTYLKLPNNGSIFVKILGKFGIKLNYRLIRLYFANFLKTCHLISYQKIKPFKWMPLQSITKYYSHVKLGYHSHVVQLFAKVIFVYLAYSRV